jgi:ABC-type transport system involved in multi-copper enzyme maturation permease subunit
MFNPGPGAGYMFAVANLTALTIAALVIVLLFDQSGRRWSSTDTLVYFSILSWAYVVALLGFGRLAINWLRRWFYVPMAAGFLLHLIIVLTGIGLPTVIQLTSRQLRYSGYSLVQMTNPIWTLGELLDDGPGAVQADILALVIPAAAFAALVLNIRSVGTELMHHRVAPPIRVAEEEAELHPAPVPGPSNPWEADDQNAPSDVAPRPSR